VIAATDTHATREELLEAVFFVRSVPRPRNVAGRQTDSQLRVAETEAGDSSGTQRKENVHRWKPLPSNAVNTVTENTLLCAIVICKA
jgi:hypothetical protein